MSTRNYIVLSSTKSRYVEYQLDSTKSDPYNHRLVRICDKKLHQALIEIFTGQRRLTAGQIKKLILAPKKSTDDHIIIKLILRHEPSIGKLLQQKKGFSLLWMVLLSYYQKSAELLVRFGADVNELYGVNSSTQLTKKSTILHALPQMFPSAWNERFTRLVMDHGADLQAQDCYDRTALHLAVEHGRVKLTEMLLEHGADVNAPRLAGVTALLDAARTSEADKLLPLLMKHGADIKVRDSEGCTVLTYLARAPGEHADLAKTFIEKGVSPRDERDADDCELIHTAVLRDKVQLVKVLLDHGANANAQDLFVDGEFPLYIAARECENPAMMTTLLKQGGNIDLKTDSGFTALYGLVALNNFSWSNKNAVEKVKILLSVGADMFAQAENGLTPFHVVYRTTMGIGLMLRAVALRKASLQPSMEFNDEWIIENRYPELLDYYEECVVEINRAKSTRFIETCTLFDLLTKCQCQIAQLMRHLQFETKFRLIDLSAFPMYAAEIMEAFERAERRYRSILDLENAIDEGTCNIFPYIIVRKVVGYLEHCENCNMKKKVQASRR